MSEKKKSKSGAPGPGFAKEKGSWERELRKSLDALYKDAIPAGTLIIKHHPWKFNWKNVGRYLAGLKRRAPLILFLFRTSPRLILTKTLWAPRKEIKQYRWELPDGSSRCYLPDDKDAGNQKADMPVDSFQSQRGAL